MAGDNARTNVPHITKKDRPLSAEHFADFERCFGPDPHGRARRAPEDAPDGRWRAFHISEVSERHFKIDALKWLKDETLDDGTDLPEPDELVTDAIAELQAAIEELQEVLVLLENGAEVASADPTEAVAAPPATQPTDVGAGLAPAQDAATAQSNERPERLKPGVR